MVGDVATSRVGLSCPGSIDVMEENPMWKTWRRGASWLVIIGIVGGTLACLSPLQARDENQYARDEVLIQLVRPADLTAVADQYHLRSITGSQSGTLGFFRMRILDGVSPRDRVAQLMADPLDRVVVAEPNYFIEPPEGQQRSSWARGEAGQYTTQWASDMIELPSAHMTSQGAGVTVAVLDTGVDRSHPALAQQLVSGYDFVDLDADPSEEGVYGQDRAYGHGTHVAGLVALVAQDAKIMPIRVLDAHGVGTVWRLTQAMKYAVDPDQDPRTADGASVINISISMVHHTTILKKFLKLAEAKNVVVVAAAGNSGTSKPEYPAAEKVPNKLSVAASTSLGDLADFSSYGKWVNVAAPGVDVVSSVPGGGYGSWSGTSMAAPLVSGITALLRASNPGLEAATVVQMIQGAAARVNAEVPGRITAKAPLANAPILELPRPITVETTAPAGAIVTYTVVARDLVDGPLTPLCQPLSHTFFTIGTTRVTCTATDADHNTATNTFTVMVRQAEMERIYLPMVNR